jgi:hypothetical protein
VDHVNARLVQRSLERSGGGARCASRCAASAPPKSSALAAQPSGFQRSLTAPKESNVQTVQVHAQAARRRASAASPRQPPAQLLCQRARTGAVVAAAGPLLGPLAARARADPPSPQSYVCACGTAPASRGCAPRRVVLPRAPPCGPAPSPARLLAPRLRAVRTRRSSRASPRRRLRSPRSEWAAEAPEAIVGRAPARRARRPRRARRVARPPAPPPPAAAAARSGTGRAGARRAVSNLDSEASLTSMEKLRRGDVHDGGAGARRVDRVDAGRGPVQHTPCKKPGVDDGELVQPEVQPEARALLRVVILQPVCGSALQGEAQQQFVQVVSVISLGFKTLAHQEIHSAQLRRWKRLTNRDATSGALRRPATPALACSRRPRHLGVSPATQRPA